MDSGTSSRGESPNPRVCELGDSAGELGDSGPGEREAGRRGLMIKRGETWFLIISFISFGGWKLKNPKHFGQRMDIIT